MDVIIKAYTFAPAFERERRFRNDGNVEVSLGRGWGWLGQAIISNRPEIGLRKKLENFSPKNLEVKKKSLPLQPQSRNDSERVLWEIYIIQQVVQVLGKLIFRIDTVNRVWLWTTITDSGARILRNNLNNEEFDPGSGWTLATGLTHASRGAAQVAIPGGDRRTGE